jgi:glycine/D-amino acid oxidase-like deaminating enzyme/nitrite reductase/ring-hydroxylating ferredoxin subunit
MCASEAPPPVSTEVLWAPLADGEVAAPFAYECIADVVVVGAGIAGLTAAVELARGGTQVVVLEGRALGEGTTGLSSAKVTVLHGTTYQKVRSTWDSEVAAAYAEANQEGLRWFHEFATGTPDRRYWEQAPAITFALDEGERSTVEREAEATADAGLPVQLVDDLALPFEHAGGVRLGYQGQVDPRRHLHHLAEELRAHGGRLRQHARVTDIERHPGGRRVRTELGSVVAEHVLVTTGLPVLDRSLSFARTTPQRSYVIAVRAPHRVHGMFISAGSKPISLRDATDPRTGEPVVLVGGEGHVTGRRRNTPGAHARLEAWAREHLAAHEVVARWSTQDRTSVDHVPFVGSVPGGGSAVRMATGFGKWGMTNGTVAGLTLAAQVTGADAPWSALFDPGRLGPVRSLPAAAKANAEVAAEMAAGWTGAELRSGRELAEGEGRVRRKGLRPVAESVVDGEHRCLGATCPHLGGIVEWNPAERSWDCPLHGSRFAADGTILDAPAVRPLPQRSDG